MSEQSESLTEDADEDEDVDDDDVVEDADESSSSLEHTVESNSAPVKA